MKFIYTQHKNRATLRVGRKTLLVGKTIEELLRIVALRKGKIQ